MNSLRGEFCLDFWLISSPALLVELAVGLSQVKREKEKARSQLHLLRSYVRRHRVTSPLICGLYVEAQFERRDFRLTYS